MSDEDFMKVVLQDAQNAKDSGNLPSATILVKNGEIIARGISHVGSDMDPSAHGDIMCIRSACKTLNTLDLSGCILYTSIEPCSMCLTCASWANISIIIFGAYKEFIASNSYLLDGYHAQDFGKKLVSLSGETIEIRGGVMGDECRVLMENVENWIPKV